MSPEVIIGVSVFTFVFGLFKVFQPASSRKKTMKKSAVTAQQASATKLVVTSSDISAIAGDDVMATQLDLARAYVETGRFLLAKKILDHVREHGNRIQQQEASELLKTI